MNIFFLWSAFAVLALTMEHEEQVSLEVFTQSHYTDQESYKKFWELTLHEHYQEWFHSHLKKLQNPQEKNRHLLLEDLKDAFKRMSTFEEFLGCLSENFDANIFLPFSHFMTLEEKKDFLAFCKKIALPPQDKRVDANFDLLAYLMKPEEAIKFLEKIHGSNPKKTWHVLLNPYCAFGENFKFIYEHRKEAGALFLNIFPEVFEAFITSQDEPREFSALKFIDALLSFDIFNEKTRELYKLFYTEGSKHYENLNFVHNSLLNKEIAKKNHRNEKNLEEFNGLDVQFLLKIAAVEMDVWQEDADTSAFSEMMELKKIIGDYLKPNRDGFNQNVMLELKNSYKQFSDLYELQLASVCKGYPDFLRTYLESLKKGTKLSLPAQCEILFHYGQKKLPEYMVPCFDKDLIGKTFSSKHCDVLKFLTNFSEVSKEILEEEKCLTIQGFSTQENSPLEKMFATSFSEVFQEFRQAVVNGKIEWVKLLLESHYGPLQHLINNILKEDTQTGLTEKEWSQIPEMHKILKEAKERYDTIKDNKKKKKKTSPLDEALERIQKSNHAQKDWPKLKLPEDYDPNFLDELQKRKTKWGDITRGIEGLGGCVEENGPHQKISFYTVEGKLVSKETYALAKGGKTEKREFAEGTHKPHNGKPLDPQFQRNVYKLIKDLFSI